jgi:hypothetical protein
MRETAMGLQMDVDKLVPSTEMMKFKQDQIQAAMQQLQAAMPQIAAPQETNVAGDTAPPPMNTVQPQQGVSA